MKSELNQIELIAKAMMIENPNNARIKQQGDKIHLLCEKIRQETKGSQQTICYYGIEVSHHSSLTWHNWGKLYISKEIAEEALASIKRDNKRLVDNGSQWRIVKLKQ